MATTEAIASLQAATAALNDVIDNAKARLAIVNQQIEQLEQQRSTINQAVPHVTEIVATYKRGLDQLASEYRGALAAQLATKFAIGPKAAASVQGTTIDLLSIGAAVNDRPLMRDGINGRAILPLGFAAVAFFLRERIEGELPALVYGLYPAAHIGMTADERREALAGVIAELAPLIEERDQLLADLAAARRPMNARPEA